MQGEAIRQGERSTLSDPAELSPTCVAYGRRRESVGSEGWDHGIRGAQPDAGGAAARLYTGGKETVLLRYGEPAGVRANEGAAHAV